MYKTVPESLLGFAACETSIDVADKFGPINEFPE